MQLLQRFQQYVRENNLFSTKDHLLLAVSGGVDSAVLAHLCYSGGFTFSMAHCNFRLRGEESDGDEAFVASLAAQYAVPYFVKGFDTERFASENKLGIQEAARQLRYDWFHELLEDASSKKPFTALLTAHQADDNIETLLMNFFKGTGIQGLQGIGMRSGKVIRPMLFAFREEIAAYAKENKLDFREDSSNLSTDYTRNYFRRELIPSIEKVFPEVRHNLHRNLGRFADIAVLYRDSIEKEKKRLLEKKGDEYHISIGRLSRAKALHSVVYEITRDFGFSPGQVEEVLALMQAGSGKRVLSATHSILNNRGWLIVAPLGNTSAAHFLISPEEKSIQFGNHRLKWERMDVPEKISSDKWVAQLDEKEIAFPLLLRRWKQGDYFYPLGMRKKKKLSRFLIDEKVSLLQKEDVWVLESAGRIIWVVGHRIDDRFKITKATKRILQVTAQ